ncbi:hypothetical protein CC2G_014649 [Coprinopsis cinerea AmutBmut pab1-1]|nr:hypothetical protein CC2G_014649 [Coprinopsis cinerea AmutBmut pab1-1]
MQQATDMDTTPGLPINTPEALLHGQTASGRVLMNSYLLSVIFDELRDAIEMLDNDQPQSSKAKREARSKMAKELLPISWTCRAFSDAAMNHVWSYLPSVVPLLQLFPGFCNKGGTNCLFRLNEPGAMDRFNRYARRVQSIVLGEFPISVAPQVYMQLALSLSGSPFLPCLKEIRVEKLDDSTLPCLQLLLSPSVRHVHIRKSSLSKSPACASSLWESLGDGRNIQTVTVYPSTIAVDSRLIPWDVVSRMKSLKRLELHMANHSIDTHAIKVLRGLPNLVHLLLKVKNMPTGTHPPPIPPNNPHSSADPLPNAPSLSSFGFTRLRTLTLPICSGAIAPQLHTIPLYSITSLTLFLQADVDTSEVWEAIGTHLPSVAHNLTTLTICSASRVLIPPEALDLLISIPRMRGLFLSRTIVYNTKDQAAETVDELYKRMLGGGVATEANSRGFDMNQLYMPRHGVGRSMSLKSCLYLAQYGKHIVHARIMVDSSLGIPSIPLSTTPEACSRSLLKLEIVDVRKRPWKPAEYEPIALFFNALFPNLESIRSIFEPETSCAAHTAQPNRHNHQDSWKLIELLRRYARRLR